MDEDNNKNPNQHPRIDTSGGVQIIQYTLYPKDLKVIFVFFFKGRQEKRRRKKKKDVINLWQKDDLHLDLNFTLIEILIL